MIESMKTKRAAVHTKDLAHYVLHKQMLEQSVRGQSPMYSISCSLGSQITFWSKQNFTVNQRCVF